MTHKVLATLLCLLVAVGAFAQTPPTPTNLTAELIYGGTQTPAVRLAWEAPQGPWGFKVYRSANDTMHFQQIGTVANTRSFFDHMVMVGTRYYYYVRSYANNQMSGPSNVVNILITPPPPPPPLPTPENLTATLVPNSWGVAVKLLWSAPRGPWTFRISRSANDTLHYQSAGSTPETTYVDRYVMPGTRYFYYVKAYALQGGGQSARSNVADILVTLPPRPRGTIRGTVVDDSTSAPIPRVSMQFFRVAGPNWYCPPPVFTDSLGRYTALLDTGRYIVRASPMCHHNYPCYRPEYFDNCPDPQCATVIAVAESSVFTANFGLSRLTPPRYVFVSGTVRDTANAPLRRARVSIIRTIQEMNYLASLGFVPGIGEEAMELDGVGHTRGVVWSGYTDSLGRYQARVVADRRYIAMASKEMYLTEYYNNKRTPETADIIFVTRDTSGIDFSLEPRTLPQNSISGIVRDSLGTRVPSRIMLLPVRPWPIPSWGNRYGHTDSLGNYIINNVAEGRYFVLAMPFSNYGHAFYKEGAYGVIRIQDADTVNIVGNVTGINIGVRRINSGGLTLVRGTIRTTGNVPLPGVLVTALGTDGEVLGIGVTDAAGAYDLDAVAPGAVTVVADRDGYRSAQVSLSVSPATYTLENVNMVMSPSGPTSVGDPSVIPAKFALDQNYPNPFNPSTTISYAITVPSTVKLSVYNVLGQEVATLVDGPAAAGLYNVVWNGIDRSGRGVSSGVYLYKLQANTGAAEFTQVRKMVLMK